MTRISNRLFFWTHFYDEQIAQRIEEYPHFDPKQDIEKEFDGYRAKHYYLSYQFIKNRVPTKFSGGNQPFAYWLQKDDILNYLATPGFTNVVMRGVEMNHKAGPCMSFLVSNPSRVAALS